MKNSDENPAQTETSVIWKWWPMFKYGGIKRQEKLVSLNTPVSRPTSDRNHALWDFLLYEKKNALFV